MPLFDTLEEARSAAKTLANNNEDWTCLPSDQPEVASFGYIVFGRGITGTPTTIEPSSEQESILYEWLPYGKRLTPEITVASDFAEFERLVGELRPNGILPCDNVRKLQLGYASYFPEVARIVRCSLARFKEAPTTPFLIELQISIARGNRNGTGDYR